MRVFKSADEIEAKVIQLLREVLPWRHARKEIKAEMLLNSDLGIDSMGLVALAFRMEEEFELELSEFSLDMGKIRTVGDVLTITRDLVGRAKEV